jgi:hypothetical protein
LAHARTAYEKTEQRFQKLRNRLNVLEQHQTPVAGLAPKEILLEKEP